MSVKLEIFDKPSTPSDPPLLLKLQSSGKDITLVVVDKFGRVRGSGHILKIKGDGTFRRMSSVSSSFGLSLDSTGRIKDTTTQF